MHSLNKSKNILIAIFALLLAMVLPIINPITAKAGSYASAYDFYHNCSDQTNHTEYYGNEGFLFCEKGKKASSTDQWRWATIGFRIIATAGGKTMTVTASTTGSYINDYFDVYESKEGGTTYLYTCRYISQNHLISLMSSNNATTWNQIINNDKVELTFGAIVSAIPPNSTTPVATLKDNGNGTVSVVHNYPDKTGTKYKANVCYTYDSSSVSNFVSIYNFSSTSQTAWKNSSSMKASLPNPTLSIKFKVGSGVTSTDSSYKIVNGIFCNADGSTFLRTGRRLGNVTLLQGDMLKRPGYQMGRWSYESANYMRGASYSTTYIYPKLGVEDTNNKTITMTLGWTPNTYTIAYNKNGGTGSMSNTSATYGVDVQLRANSFTAPDGYEFAGWALSANGDVVYMDKQSVRNLTTTNKGTVTLYAKWIGVESKLIIDPSDGIYNGSSELTVVTGRYKDTCVVGIPTKDGYSFTGWIQRLGTNDGSVTGTYSDGVYTFGKAKGASGALIATYRLIDHTISYRGNGGTSGGADYSMPFFKSALPLTIRSNEYERPGYEFVNWNTKADGTGTSYNPGDEYSTFADATLYAQWRQYGSSLIVDPNGGEWSGSTAVQTKTGLSGSTISIPVPSREGYSFAGWKMTGGYGTLAQPWTSATTYKFGIYDSVSDTITAQWDVHKWTVTYIGNGASNGTTASQTKIYKTDLILENSGFTRSGYRFSHWNTNPNGTGTTYAAYSTYSTDADLTLYAIWTPVEEADSNKYAFDTDLDLPTVGVTNVTLKYDTATEGNTVDYGSNTTNVKFTGWAPYSTYTAGKYYYMQPSTDNEAKLISLINCGQCDNLQFHGKLSGLLNRHYDFNHGNWADNASENKKEERNSLAVATFNGSWLLRLPNAYKTGYVFTGWYAKNENGTETYIGMGGDVFDTSTWVRNHNTSSSSGLKTSTITTGTNGNLESVTLYPHFEPIRYKVLYVMNIPNSTDTATANGGLQSHSTMSNATALSDVHSLRKNGSEGKAYVTATQMPASVGSASENSKYYSYIGTKTYTYDGTDWALENIPITVNDYFFTGWTYEDICWTGYGGMQANGVTLGSTVIGGSIEATHNTSSDYSLKTLYMSANAVQNVQNNLPHAQTKSGNYTSFYTVNGAALSAPQSDGTNASAGTKVSGKNISAPTVYIVLKANWTADTPFNNNVMYNSNNREDSTYTQDNAFVKLTDYINIFTINDSKLNGSAFGQKYPNNMIDSSDTAYGYTGDDNSYDNNATSDMFFVDDDNKYYSGISNGRTGFFSFQGWSTWKYATWRDAVDSNKKDTDNSEMQNYSGHDSGSINSSFTSGSLTAREYNDVSRSKRVGDLFYRMTAVLYPNTVYNGTMSNYNNNGVMLNANGVGEKFKTSLSSNILTAYKWRWQKGTTGNYAIPIKGVLDTGVKLYAIWDAYPTSTIQNTYCYIDDIDCLTPGYLFSKVIARDYEDFWNQQYYQIGETHSGTVDWNTVASASAHMNDDYAYTCPDGDYTYTYNLASGDAWMGGRFTATLIGYDYDRFVNATFVDDIAAVSITYKFVDSAGNTTFKTAWVYIIDEESTSNRDPDFEDTDNTRYSTTRFISEEFYNKALFDEDGNYVVGSADEEAGSLLIRSKWYMNPNYRNQLKNAFANLEDLGNSKLTFSLTSPFDVNTFEVVNPFRAVWSGLYHPQLNTATDEWEYNKSAIREKTVGVYELTAEDIMNTKEFLRDHDYDTGTYTGNTVQEYIDEIFSDTAWTIDGVPHRITD